jgi:hypothetical protein
MRKIIVIGSCEQSDFMLSVCKVLAHIGDRTLLIDGTRARNTSHYVSSLTDVGPVVEFDGFDLGNQFATYQEALTWLDRHVDKYGYVMMQSDDIGFLTGCKLSEFDSHVIVTNVEKGSFHRNLHIVSQLIETSKPTIEFIHLYIPFVISSIQERYVEEMYGAFALRWSENIYRIHFDEKLFERFIDNQYAESIQLQGLPRAYIHKLLKLTVQLTTLDLQSVKQAFKQAKRRR